MGRRFVAIIAAGVVALIGVAALLLLRQERGLPGGRRSGAGVGLRGQGAGAGRYRPQGRRQRPAHRQGHPPAKSVPGDHLKAVDTTNESLLALGDIAPGQYILNSQFGTTPTGRKAISVDPGMVALTITLADASRVGTFLTPGSRIIIDGHLHLRGSSGGSPRRRGDRAAGCCFRTFSCSPSVSPRSRPASRGPDDAAAGRCGNVALVTLALTPDDALAGRPRPSDRDSSTRRCAALTSRSTSAGSSRNTDSSLFARK